MLKKLLILALTVHISHILPSDPPPLSLKASLGLAVPGVVCAWIAIKTFKEQVQAANEVGRQAQNLRDMGAKADVKQDIQYIGASSYIIRSSCSMEIPSSFSSEQKEQANKYWELLSTNYRISKCEKRTWIITLSGMGSFFLLIPIGEHIKTALTKPSAP